MRTKPTTQAPTPKRTVYTSLWDGEPDGFRTFLRQMGRHPLLKEQELPTAKLARAYLDFERDCDQARAALIEQGIEPTEADVWAAAGFSLTDAAQHLSAGRKATRQMVESNLRLVVDIAKRYTTHVSLEDRTQEGTIGLLHAVCCIFTTSAGYSHQLRVLF